MELLLQRTIKHKHYTLGTLSIGGEPFCHTLEPTWRDIGWGRPGRKVQGRTAIPDGRYPVAVTFSARHGLWLPVLLHVPLFKGARIHAGYAVQDVEEGILVGIRQDRFPERLFDSRLWLHRLVRRLAERPLGEGVWITAC